MDFIVKLLFFGGKYITLVAGRTLIELINSSFAIHRNLSVKYEKAVQIVKPYDNMLELLNSHVQDVNSNEDDRFVKVTDEVRRGVEDFNAMSGSSGDDPSALDKFTNENRTDPHVTDLPLSNVENFLYGTIISDAKFRNPMEIKIKADRQTIFANLLNSYSGMPDEEEDIYTDVYKDLYKDFKGPSCNNSSSSVAVIKSTTLKEGGEDLEFGGTILNQSSQTASYNKMPEMIIEMKQTENNLPFNVDNRIPNFLNEVHLESDPVSPFGRGVQNVAKSKSQINIDNSNAKADADLFDCFVEGEERIRQKYDNFGCFSVDKNCMLNKSTECDLSKAHESAIEERHNNTMKRFPLGGNNKDDPDHFLGLYSHWSPFFSSCNNMDQLVRQLPGDSYYQSGSTGLENTRRSVEQSKNIKLQVNEEKPKKKEFARNKLDNDLNSNIKIISKLKNDITDIMHKNNEYFKIFEKKLQDSLLKTKMKLASADVSSSSATVQNSSHFNKFEMDLNRKLTQKIDKIHNRRKLCSITIDCDEMLKQHLDRDTKFVTTNEKAFRKLERKITQLLIERGMESRKSESDVTITKKLQPEEVSLNVTGKCSLSDWDQREILERTKLIEVNKKVFDEFERYMKSIVILDRNQSDMADEDKLEEEGLKCDVTNTFKGSQEARAINKTLKNQILSLLNKKCPETRTFSDKHRTRKELILSHGFKREVLDIRKKIFGCQCGVLHNRSRTQLLSLDREDIRKRTDPLKVNSKTLERLEGDLSSLIAMKKASKLSMSSHTLQGENNMGSKSPTIADVLKEMLDKPLPSIQKVCDTKCRDLSGKNFSRSDDDQLRENHVDSNTRANKSSQTSSNDFRNLQQLNEKIIFHRKDTNRKYTTQKKEDTWNKSIENKNDEVNNVQQTNYKNSATTNSVDTSQSFSDFAKNSNVNIVVVCANVKKNKTQSMEGAKDSLTDTIKDGNTNEIKIASNLCKNILNGKPEMDFQNNPDNLRISAIEIKAASLEAGELRIKPREQGSTAIAKSNEIDEVRKMKSPEKPTSSNLFEIFNVAKGKYYQFMNQQPNLFRQNRSEISQGNKLPDSSILSEKTGKVIEQMGCKMYTQETKDENKNIQQDTKQQNEIASKTQKMEPNEIKQGSSDSPPLQKHSIIYTNFDDKKSRNVDETATSSKSENRKGVTPEKTVMQHTERDNTSRGAIFQNSEQRSTDRENQVTKTKGETKVTYPENTEQLSCVRSKLYFQEIGNEIKVKSNNKANEVKKDDIMQTKILKQSADMVDTKSEDIANKLANFSKDSKTTDNIFVKERKIANYNRQSSVSDTSPSVNVRKQGVESAKMEAESSNCKIRANSMARKENSYKKNEKNTENYNRHLKTLREHSNNEMEKTDPDIKKRKFAFLPLKANRYYEQKEPDSNVLNNPEHKELLKPDYSNVTRKEQDNTAEVVAVKSCGPTKSSSNASQSDQTQSQQKLLDGCIENYATLNKERNSYVNNKYVEKMTSNSKVTNGAKDEIAYQQPDSSESHQVVDNNQDQGEVDDVYAKFNAKNQCQETSAFKVSSHNNPASSRSVIKSNNIIGSSEKRRQYIEQNETEPQYNNCGQKSENYKHGSDECGHHCNENERFEEYTREYNKEKQDTRRDNSISDDCGKRAVSFKECIKRSNFASNWDRKLMFDKNACEVLNETSRCHNSCTNDREHVAENNAKENKHEVAKADDTSDNYSVGNWQNELSSSRTNLSANVDAEMNVEETEVQKADGAKNKYSRERCCKSNRLATPRRVDTSLAERDQIKNEDDDFIVDMYSTEDKAIEDGKADCISNEYFGIYDGSKFSSTRPVTNIKVKEELPRKQLDRHSNKYSKSKSSRTVSNAEDKEIQDKGSEMVTNQYSENCIKTTNAMKNVSPICPARSRKADATEGEQIKDEEAGHNFSNYEENKFASSRSAITRKVNTEYPSKKLNSDVYKYGKDRSAFLASKRGNSAGEGKQIQDEKPDTATNKYIKDAYINKVSPAIRPTTPEKEDVHSGEGDPVKGVEFDINNYNFEVNKFTSNRSSANRKIKEEQPSQKIDCSYSKYAKSISPLSMFRNIENAQEGNQIEVEKSDAAIGKHSNHCKENSCVSSGLNINKGREIQTEECTTGIYRKNPQPKVVSRLPEDDLFPAKEGTNVAGKYFKHHKNEIVPSRPSTATKAELRTKDKLPVEDTNNVTRRSSLSSIRTKGTSSRSLASKTRSRENGQVVNEATETLADEDSPSYIENKFFSANTNTPRFSTAPNINQQKVEKQPESTECATSIKYTNMKCKTVPSEVGAASIEVKYLTEDDGTVENNRRIKFVLYRPATVYNTDVNSEESRQSIKARQSITKVYTKNYLKNKLAPCRSNTRVDLKLQNSAIKQTGCSTSHSPGKAEMEKEIDEKVPAYPTDFTTQLYINEYIKNKLTPSIPEKSRNTCLKSTSSEQSLVEVGRAVSSAQGKAKKFDSPQPNTGESTKCYVSHSDNSNKSSQLNSLYLAQQKIKDLKEKLQLQLSNPRNKEKAYCSQGRLNENKPNLDNVVMNKEPEPERDEYVKRESIFSRFPFLNKYRKASPPKEIVNRNVSVLNQEIIANIRKFASDRYKTVEREKISKKKKSQSNSGVNYNVGRRKNKSSIRTELTKIKTSNSSHSLKHSNNYAKLDIATNVDKNRHLISKTYTTNVALNSEMTENEEAVQKENHHSNEGEESKSNIYENIPFLMKIKQGCLRQRSLTETNYKEMENKPISGGNLTSTKFRKTQERVPQPDEYQNAARAVSRFPILRRMSTTSYPNPVSIPPDVEEYKTEAEARKCEKYIRNNRCSCLKQCYTPHLNRMGGMWNTHSDVASHHDEEEEYTDNPNKYRLSSKQVRTSLGTILRDISC